MTKICVPFLEDLSTLKTTLLLNDTIVVGMECYYMTLPQAHELGGLVAVHIVLDTNELR